MKSYFWNDEEYGNREVVCPYCGEQESLDGDGLDDGHNVMEECAGCGRSYAYEVEWEPTTTSCRYHGRTIDKYINGTQRMNCSICGKPLEPQHRYRKCPICDAVVCHSCDEQRKPCCDEYKRWLSDADVVNDEVMSKLFSDVWAVIGERYEDSHDRCFSDMMNAFDIYDEQPIRDALKDVYGFTHADPDITMSILDFLGIDTKDDSMEDEDD